MVAKTLYFTPLLDNRGGYLFCSRPTEVGEVLTLLAQEDLPQGPSIGLTTSKPLTITPNQLSSDPKQTEKLLSKNNNICSFFSPNWDSFTINRGDVIRIKIHSQGAISIKLNSHIVVEKERLLDPTDRPLFLTVGPCPSAQELQLFDESKLGAELALYILGGRTGKLPPCSAAKALFRLKSPAPSASSTPAPTSPPAPAPIHPEPTPFTTVTCAVCKESVANMVTIPCGHLVTCRACTDCMGHGAPATPHFSNFETPDDRPGCVTCREPVAQVLQLSLEKQPSLCRVCKKDKPTAVAKPCGHIQLCGECCKKMKDIYRLGGRRPNCSICNRHVAKFYHIYMG